jgi:hypothetical protein
MGNAAAFIYFMVSRRKANHFVNASAANLLCVGLSRHPATINMAYKCVCSLPRSAPLRLRWLASKVSHYGGIHSGCGISAALWYIGFVALLTHDYVSLEPDFRATSAILGIAYTVLALLLAIIVVAYPVFRAKRHDNFEFVHRFSGWISIALYWPLLILLGRRFKGPQSLGKYLIDLPAFWILVILTLVIIHPWLSLERIAVQPEPISNHAVRLHFKSMKPEFAKGFAVSRHPLRDWHGFAQFPDLDGKVSSCLVSRAGDWTSECIEAPPTYLWKRGIPVRGFGYCLKMFHSCIVVATGSGIGPCLSFLALKDRPRLRVIWQTRSPLATYGQDIIDAVHRLDSQAIIIDSSLSKTRRDMVPDVLELVKQEKAESVAVISNYFFTQRMIFEVEARGIPAFGPVFDS